MNTYILFDSRALAFKIGRSKDPQQRLQELQTGAAGRLWFIDVLPGDHERKLHARFAAHRLRGEWFELNFDSLLLLQHLLMNRHIFKNLKDAIEQRFQAFVMFWEQLDAEEEAQAEIRAELQAQAKSPQGRRLKALVDSLPTAISKVVPGES